MNRSKALSIAHSRIKWLVTVGVFAFFEDNYLVYLLKP